MSGISTANSSAAICVPSPVFLEFAMPSGVCKYSLVFCLCNSLVSSDTGRPIAAHDAEQCRPLLRCLTPHLGQFFSLYCPLILSLSLLRKPLIYYFPPLYPTFDIEFNTSSAFSLSCSLLAISRTLFTSAMPSSIV